MGGTAAMSSSRLIVKNLPKHFTTEKLREKFSAKVRTLGVLAVPRCPNGVVDDDDDDDDVEEDVHPIYPPVRSDFQAWVGCY